MIALSSLSLMSFAVATPVVPVPCKSAQEIIATGKVSTLPPDAKPLGIEVVAKGLQISEATNVRWDQCGVRLQSRVYGGWAITSDGVPVIPVSNHLMTRADPILPAEPEPQHPKIPGAHFVSSAPLTIGDIRAGLWIQPGGRSLIASYRPGSSDAPRPLLRSAQPIIGLFYIGSPDARGGILQFWQRLSDRAYRHISMSWSEEGVR